MADVEDTNRTDMSYLQHLRDVALAGVALIVEKTRTYGPSWKRRGGAGAWFTTVRPWDRLEGIVGYHGGDVFAAVRADPSGADGSALGCLRDIRNYTILIEAEMIARGVVVAGPTPQETERPTRAYVDQDHGGSMDPPQDTGRMGAGPLTPDGCYTILDLGHGDGLWHEGLSALPWPWPGATSVLHEGMRSLRDATLLLETASSGLVASRRLVGGDMQVLIRISRPSATALTNGATD